MTLSFKALSEDQARYLISLLEISAGDEIGLIDWHGRTWKGFIPNNPSEIVEGLEGCNYTANFKFEGSLQ